MKKIIALSILLLGGCASVEKIGELETATVYKAAGCVVFAIKQPPEQGHVHSELNYFFSCPQK